MIASALTAALAVTLLVGPSPARAAARLIPHKAQMRRGPGVLWAAGASSMMVAAWALLGTRPLLWAVTAGIAGATVWWLTLGQRKRTQESRAAEECAQAARVLSSLMRAGCIPSVALKEAATDFPVLQSAASAARLGADVGRELEQMARGPGRGGLRSVAAAWRLSERTGAPIADVLARVAENLRRQRQLDAVVATELAAARASGHIMAALPFLAVGLGLAAGVNTVEYLLREPIGQILVFAGVSLTSAGVLWVDRLAGTGGRTPRATR